MTMLSSSPANDAHHTPLHDGEVPFLDYDAAAGMARADLCRFLAACYYQPDPAFTEERMFETMLEAARQVGPGMADAVQRLGAAFSADSLEDLLIDYTRLFLGPVKALASPYGSVWMDVDGQVMNQSTMALTDLYKSAGFEIADDFLDLPDHIAVELEFLYLLLFREHEARSDGDLSALSANIALRGAFIDGHIGRWVEPFAASVAAGAQCAFYRELAPLTRRVIDIEATRVVPV